MISSPRFGRMLERLNPREYCRLFLPSYDAERPSFSETINFLEAILVKVKDHPGLELAELLLSKSEGIVKDWVEKIIIHHRLQIEDSIRFPNNGTLNEKLIHSF